MKKWYESKTVWVNVFLFISAVLSAFGFVGELPADWEVFVIPVIAVINIILRFVTKQSIA